MVSVERAMMGESGLGSQKGLSSGSGWSWNSELLKELGLAGRLSPALSLSPCSLKASPGGLST